MAGELLVDRPADGVQRLTIHNPAKRNALDGPVLDAIAAAVDGLDARCLVLTGAGDMFSSGYDLGDPSTSPDDEAAVAAAAERLVAHPFTAALAALDATDVPTVAALNGHALGGGLELALACDLRLAAPGVRVGMPPARLGLVYSHTGLRRFVDVVGAARTRELFLLGATVAAHDAEAWGLVHRVVAGDALEATALELAGDLVANAPLSLSGTKRILRALLAAEGELDTAVEDELLALRQASFASEDLREGMRAFAEKRPARWRGR